MSRLKALIKDKKLYEFTIFACITIALLCSIFFVIKNFSEIVDIGLSFWQYNFRFCATNYWSDYCLYSGSSGGTY